MPRPAHPLRDIFEAALLAYINAHGENFERRALVQDFVDRGVAEATVYRWIAGVLERGAVTPPRASGSTPGPAADAPPAPDPPLMIVGALPSVPRINDVRTMGLVPVIELLQDCIRTAQELMKHSRSAAGDVRNARLLAQGSEHLRKSVETAAKLNETVAIQQEMERFHAAVLEEISREPHAAQERLLVRLRRVCDAALDEN